MTNQELLISRITLLSKEDIVSLLDATALMEKKNTPAIKPHCPYYGFHTVICYGHKCRKQRLFCKSYGRTFVPTTNTICQTPISRKMNGAKSSKTLYTEMLLTIPQIGSAVRIRLFGHEA